MDISPCILAGSLVSFDEIRREGTAMTMAGGVLFSICGAVTVV
jgi:hypothetical protein